MIQYDWIYVADVIINKFSKLGKNFIKKSKNFSEKWPFGSGHSQQATHPCSRRGKGNDDGYDDDDNV